LQAPIRWNSRHIERLCGPSEAGPGKLFAQGRIEGEDLVPLLIPDHKIYDLRVGDRFVQAVPAVLAENGGITGDQAVGGAVFLNEAGKHQRDGHDEVGPVPPRLNGGGKALAKDAVRRAQGWLWFI